MVVHTLPDIVGPVQANPITTDRSLIARWILITAATPSVVVGAVTAVVCGVGDTADATHGAHLQPNVPVLYPPDPIGNGFYQLSDMQAYVPAGTTLTITYAS